MIQTSQISSTSRLVWNFPNVSKLPTNSNIYVVSGVYLPIRAAILTPPVTELTPIRRARSWHRWRSWSPRCTRASISFNRRWTACSSTTIGCRTTWSPRRRSATRCSTWYTPGKKVRRWARQAGGTVQSLVKVAMHRENRYWRSNDSIRLQRLQTTAPKAVPFSLFPSTPTSARPSPKSCGLTTLE